MGILNNPIQPRIADPGYQTLVSQAARILPPLGQGQSVLIFNQDLLNNAYVGYDSGITVNGPNTITIPALTYQVIDASRATYGCAAGLVNIQIVPGGTYASASPAQIALQIAASGLMLNSTGVTIKNTLGTPAQTVDISGQTTSLNSNIPANIATTGVPLLSSVSNQINQSGTLTAGNNVQYTCNPTQIGYEIFLSLICADAVAPFMKVNLTWVDTATGFVTAAENWYLACGSGSAQIIAGTGPTKGNKLTITITSLANTTSCTYVVAYTQNSRVYVRDDWQNIGWLAVQGYSLPNSDIEAGLMCQFSNTVTNATNAQRLMPLYSGSVAGFVASPAGDNGLLTLLFPAGTIQAAATAYYQNPVAAGSQAPFETALPRSNILMQIANTGATSGIYGVSIIQKEMQP